jgi:hypothetical protein
MLFIIKKFGHIDLRNKNWPNDPWISFKSPSSSVDFIETDVNLKQIIEIDVKLEEELEKFKRALERDEIMKL